MAGKDYDHEVCIEYRDKTNRMYRILFEGNGDSMMTAVSKNTDFRLKFERIAENITIKIVTILLINGVLTFGAMILAEKIFK